MGLCGVRMGGLLGDAVILQASRCRLGIRILLRCGESVFLVRCLGLGQGFVGLCLWFTVIGLLGHLRYLGCVRGLLGTVRATGLLDVVHSLLVPSHVC